MVFFSDKNVKYYKKEYGVHLTVISGLRGWRTVKKILYVFSFILIIYPLPKLPFIYS